MDDALFQVVSSAAGSKDMIMSAQSFNRGAIARKADPILAEMYAITALMSERLIKVSHFRVIVAASLSRH